jgi:hypothetical protein
MAKNLKDYEVLLMNTSLLGFDVNYYSKRYSIVFNKDMFKQYLTSLPPRANNKGMAAFLYFLLTIMDSSAEEKFRTCWFPDNSTMREFKQVCVEEIKVLEEKSIVVLYLIYRYLRIHY